MRSNTLKGSQRMGGLWIFLKNRRASLFKATFRMNLISAGSISLNRPLMVNSAFTIQIHTTWYFTRVHTNVKIVMYIPVLGEFVKYSRPERFWLMTSGLGTGKSLTFFTVCSFLSLVLSQFGWLTDTVVRIRFAAKTIFLWVCFMFLLIQMRTLQIPCLDLRFTLFGGRTDAKKQNKMFKGCRKLCCL